MFIHLRLKVRHGKFVTRLYIHWMKENYSGEITVLVVKKFRLLQQYYVDGKNLGTKCFKNSQLINLFGT